MAENEEKEKKSSVGAAGTGAAALIIAITGLVQAVAPDGIIGLLGGGGEPEILFGTPFGERSGMLSPDDNWLAYVSDESGRDEVYVRPFPGPVHAKDTLIDDQFLIVGSHNFHWSAFGTGQGLAEYSLGVADPQAISDFERFFEYHWERAGLE